jgi:ubiquinone/menaquinone biosynthesis C-methylase UbiE
MATTSQPHFGGDDGEPAQPLLTIEQLYTSTPEGDQFEQELEQSLHPRSKDMLLDMVTEAGLPPEPRIIDVGCGYGYWSCQLAERLGAQVLAIDIVPACVAGTIERVKAAGLEDRVVVQQASIHHLPADPESYDVVWCTDMLNHVHDLVPAMRECYRVARPGGAMVVFQTFAGELLEPREAERLYWGQGIVPENMAPEYVEHAFTEAGFSLMKRDVIASEWREHDVESGNQTVLQRLLHAARLLRNRDYFVHRYGQGLYEQALGDAQWFPFQMLGKLMSVAFLLRREATDVEERAP